MSQLICILFCLTVCASEITASTELEALSNSLSPTELKLGHEIYKSHCMACHAKQNIMVASPKWGDQNDWNSRLKNRGSIEKLVASAVKGFKAMPRKGNCTKCGEKELRAAIIYMFRGIEGISK